MLRRRRSTLLVAAIAYSNAVTRQEVVGCWSSAGSLRDRFGYACNSPYYSESSNCGDYDTEEFKAAEFCCECGGGIADDVTTSRTSTSSTIPPITESQAPVCIDTEVAVRDSFGYGCNAPYYSRAVSCGAYDTRDFEASKFCCQCGGGSQQSTVAPDVLEFLEGNLSFHARASCGQVRTAVPVSLGEVFGVPSTRFDIKLACPTSPPMFQGSWVWLMDLAPGEAVQWTMQVNASLFSKELNNVRKRKAASGFNRGLVQNIGNSLTELGVEDPDVVNTVLKFRWRNMSSNAISGSSTAAPSVNPSSVNVAVLMVVLIVFLAAVATGTLALLKSGAGAKDSESNRVTVEMRQASESA